MGWKDHFEKSFLTTGKRLYSERRVSDVFYVDNRLNATVLNKSLYVVSIKNPGSENPIMYCSCEIAEKGYRCMHMAAVMYLWESEYEDKEPRKEEILINDVFPDNSDREFYYDINRIAENVNLTINPEILKKTQGLIKNDSIQLDEIKQGYMRAMYGDDGTSVLRTYFSIRGADPCYIYLSEEDIVDCYCGVCGYYLRDFIMGTFFSDNEIIEPCEHILGALILLHDYIRRFDPGDRTDMSGDMFLDYYMGKRKRNAIAENAEEYGNIQLVPRIINETFTDPDYFKVTFRIGNGGKLYVIKNLADLFEAEEKGEIMTLGKKTEINFKTERFDKKSEVYYRILKKIFNESKARYYGYGDYDNYNTYYDMKEVPLNGSILDAIFENNKGGEVDYKTYNSPNTFISIKSFTPAIEIDVNVSSSMGRSGKKRLEAISVSGTLPTIIYGSEKKYIFYNNTISEISEETSEKLIPFLKTTGYDGKTFDFTIGRKMAAEFYYRILPELMNDNSFEVNIVDEIEELINPEAKVTFYLDAEDGQIFCRAEASYDDNNEKKHIIKPTEEDDSFPESYRDIYRENVIRELLGELFESFYPDKQSYAIEDRDDAKYEFLRFGIGLLFAEGEVQSTDAFAALKIRQRTPVQLGVSVKSNLLDIELMTGDIDEDELSQILESYHLKKKYHRLRSGDFVELEGNEELDSFVNTMDALGVSPEDFSEGNLKLPVYRALYLDSMLEEHEELVADRDKHFRSLIKNFKTINDSDFDVPECLKKIYRPYQEYGFKWLKTLETTGFSGILADDMGLGKTVQILGALLHYKEENTHLCAIVICPASLVYNWAEEAKKFVPSLKCSVLAGTKKDREELLKKPEDTDIFITSYDLLKRDIKHYENVTFTHEILDEAQFVKNAKAIAAKSVKLIKAEHRMALTGTPIENRLSELWSIFDFLMPGFLYNYEEFKKKYELPISKYGKEETVEALKKQVSPFILRRKKEDVLKELPSKQEEVVYSVMEEKQRTLYDAQLVRTKNVIAASQEEFNKKKIQILAELTKLRQICCDPELLFEDFTGGSAKRETCMELVKNAADAGHKMLLFSQFTSMLELLEADLVKENISFYKITGATSKEERIRLVKDFNADETPVFLISLKAGGTGLNLTGADIVIHYDPWWNTAAQDQATDRAHRIGQTKNVTVYKLIAKGSIEEKILKLQETKKELADSILSGETKSLGSMSKEDLMEILG